LFCATSQEPIALRRQPNGVVHVARHSHVEYLPPDASLLDTADIPLREMGSFVAKHAARQTTAVASF
jgi:hypothetical protein